MLPSVGPVERRADETIAGRQDLRRFVRRTRMVAFVAAGLVLAGCGASAAPKPVSFATDLGAGTAALRLQDYNGAT